MKETATQRCAKSKAESWADAAARTGLQSRGKQGIFEEQKKGSVPGRRQTEV